jgi:hypothetical protein
MCDEDGIGKCWKEMEKLKDSGLAKCACFMPADSVPILAVANFIAPGVLVSVISK